MVEWEGKKLALSHLHERQGVRLSVERFEGGGVGRGEFLLLEKL
jgi:hypothetical protein